MTDSPTLREAFEDQISENDDWGDLSEEDIHTTLLDIADREWGNVGVRRTRRITEDTSFITPFIKQNLENNSSFIAGITRKKDFGFFENLITRGIQAPLAERIGIERARQSLKSNITNQEAIDYLRKHDPRTLGGFAREAQRRGQRFAALFS